MLLEGSVRCQDGAPLTNFLSKTFILELVFFLIIKKINSYLLQKGKKRG